MFTVLLSLIIVGMLVLFYRKRKVFTALLLTAVIGISLGNSVLSCYIQYRTHTHPREEAVEMEELRQFVLKHPESTFAVLPPFSGGDGRYLFNGLPECVDVGREYDMDPGYTEQI